MDVLAPLFALAGLIFAVGAGAIFGVDSRDPLPDDHRR